MRSLSLVSVLPAVDGSAHSLSEETAHGTGGEVEHCIAGSVTSNESHLDT